MQTLTAKEYERIMETVRAFHYYGERRIMLSCHCPSCRAQCTREEVDCKFGPLVKTDITQSCED